MKKRVSSRVGERACIRLCEGEETECEKGEETKGKVVPTNFGNKLEEISHWEKWILFYD